MEQHIGHQAYYQNLRRFIDQAGDLEATWIPVTYALNGRIWRAPWPLPDHLRGALAGRIQVRRGLRRAPYDVALFNTQVPAVLAGRMVRQRPYVLSTDITPIQYDQMGAHYDHRPDRAGLLRRLKHRANVHLLRNAARLLPWSTWTRASLIADYGVDPTRIEVMPPGVDVAAFRPQPQSNNGAHANGRLRILFVGGDFYRKGGAALLAAWQTLPPGTAELRLVTHSSVPAGEGIHVYSNLQPNTPELISLFHSSDLFVLPTQAEAFGIAAVEASAAGLPVVATAVGGLTDIVVDGKTGYLIPPGDVAALAACLRRLAEDAPLRQRLGEAAHAHAARRFDARRNAQRIAAILREHGARKTNHE
jgi:glycosyltransferase involved in cell wall biosynthesis